MCVCERFSWVFMITVIIFDFRRHRLRRSTQHADASSLFVDSSHRVGREREDREKERSAAKVKHMQMKIIIAKYNERARARCMLAMRCADTNTENVCMEYGQEERLPKKISRTFLSLSLCHLKLNPGTSTFLCFLFSF